jgi:hypothetical protein
MPLVFLLISLGCVGYLTYKMMTSPPPPPPTGGAV